MTTDILERLRHWFDACRNALHESYGMSPVVTSELCELAAAEIERLSVEIQGARDELAGARNECEALRSRVGELEKINRNAAEEWAETDDAFIAAGVVMSDGGYHKPHADAIEELARNINSLNDVLRRAGWGQGEIDNCTAVVEELEENAARWQWVRENAAPSCEYGYWEIPSLSSEGGKSSLVTKTPERAIEFTEAVDSARKG